MTLRRFVSAAALVAVATSPGVPAALGAQAVVPPCASQQAQDACQKTADLFTLLAPQLGALAAGGSPTPGQVGLIGGLGHVSLGVRVNGVRGDVPDVRQSSVGAGAAEQGSIPTRERLLLLPVVDLSLGLLNGVLVGGSHVGGLDLLVSGSWLPAIDEAGTRIAPPAGNVRVSLGARLGLLRETLHMPALDFTVMRRQLPGLEVRSLTAAGDSLTLGGMRVRSDSWRLVAGKSFLSMAVAGGVGQDRYASTADAAAMLGGSGSAGVRLEPVGLEQRLTRTNAFASLTVDAAPLRLVAELGRAWGGSLATFNELQGARADAPRFHGSLGIRVGF